MLLPQTFNIYGHYIGTSFLILLFSGLFSIFIYWHEIRRDGFDEEKALDLFLICLFSGTTLSRFTHGVLSSFPPKEILILVTKFWTPGFNAIGLIVGFLFPIFLFTKSWKWSVYRMTDIFAITTCVGSIFTLFGWYLLTGSTVHFVGSVAYLVISILLFNLRFKFRSGLVFSFFLLANIALGLVIFRTLPYLIFYFGLFTISILNLYKRERLSPMKTSISNSFISQMKSILKNKDKKLAVEQKLLMDEDPYMVEGRDSDNEYLDDVNEDIQKETYDIRMKSIKTLRSKVSAAINKINQGSYGRCDVCGEQISEERLKAYPEATTCVNHVSKE